MSDPIRLFVGYEPKEEIGLHAFLNSLMRTSRGFSIEPLCGFQADGTNAFTYERFRIPEICGFSGKAIFVDGTDMLMLAPLAELAGLFNTKYAVQVVKHDYKTKHPIKYKGSALECPNLDYPRKNWSSVILWNCAHIAHYEARERLKGTDGKFLHRFAWLKDEQIGELPPEWNHLVGELPRNPRAKLAHFTLGIPGFDYYFDCEYAEEWRCAAKMSMTGMQYELA